MSVPDQACPKALFVANSDWYLYNFRSSLIRQAEEAGWQIALICTHGPYVSRLEEQGWRVIPLPLESAGANPLREGTALAQLARTLRAERPTVVHLFTLKCVLYGCLAAPAIPRAHFIGALTGMGYLFTSTSRKARVLKQIVLAGLRLGLKQSRAQLIFENEFDCREFLDARLLPASRTHVIRGAGVDCSRFNPANHEKSSNGQLRVLYCGRLIAEKGIRDYLAAINALKESGYRFTSRIAGEPYPGNPSSLSNEEVDNLSRDERHVYLGHQSDIPALLAITDVVILPTYYREGTPTILLEAAAAGCLIITTTIPACADIVDEGKNGRYVAPRSPKQIQAALVELIQMSSDDRAAMSACSRRIAEERFSHLEVNERTLNLYPSLTHEQALNQMP